MDYIQWEIFIPFYKNRMIVRGLLAAVGFPVAAAVIFGVFFFEKFRMAGDIAYLLGLIGMFYVLVLGLLFDRRIRRFAPGYIVDREGIINYSVPKVRKMRSRRLKQTKESDSTKKFSKLRLIPKLFFLHDDRLGGGLPAQTHQITNIRWKEIGNVKYSPKNKMLVIKSISGERVYIFCHETNYEQVSHLVFKNTINRSATEGV